MPADGDEPSVSGTIVNGLVVVAKETLGESVVARGLAMVPKDAAALVLAALPGQWIPIAGAEVAFSGVARAVGRDWASLHSELSCLSVERAVKTFWRVLLRFTSDEALVARTPVIYGKSYNRGRLVPRITGPGRGQVDLVDWPDVPEWPIRGSRSGIETVLRVSGRKDVHVEGQRTPTGATYIATWR